MAIPAQSRAYSIIAIKAISDDQRVLTGMATTPAPDRHGDIVEPLGLSFDNPAPLLLYHDPTQPVGTVKFSKPTPAGLPFEAHIPDISEPGPLRDRIQEAWLSAKAGLLRGVSVRLMAKADDVELLKNGGYRFRKAKVLELSLVTIPANAEASVDSIKALDAATRTALGLSDESVIHRPGASGSSRVVHAHRDPNMKKSYAEQIKDFEATRAAKVGEMDALLEKAADGGVTLDADEQKTHDELADEVKSIDSHLVRLRAAETRNREAAKSVDGTTQDRGMRSRDSQIITVKEQTLPVGIPFTRMVICKAVSAMSRGVVSAVEVAQQRYPSQPSIVDALKTGVNAATTTDANNAGPLATLVQYTGDFVTFLRAMTILGKFGTNGIPALRAVPFNVNIKAQTGGGTGYWVGQGKAKPLTAQQYDDIQLLYTKVAAISVATQESLRFSSPSLEQLIRNDLAAALAERMDIDFIDPDKAAVSNVSPASITHGLTAIPSSGNDLDAVTTDIKAIYAPFMAANLTPSTGVWIMNSTTALALSLMRTALGDFAFPNISMQGGTFNGLPVIVSDYVSVSGSPTSHIVVLANASDIYLADDGQVTVNASTEASLEMDDSPSGDATNATGAQLVSMFQTNSVALLAERFVNWKKRRPEAVAYLDGVAWGSA